MKYQSVIACIVGMCLCLAGAAGAQEKVFAQPEQAFQSGAGLVGGVDTLVLRAYGNRYDAMAHGVLFGDAVTPSNDFEISPRVWLGYVGQSGFGIRSRWFQYQHDLKAGSGTFDEVVGRNYLDVYAADIEFTQQVDLGCWKLNAGAGLRAGGVKRRMTLQQLGQDSEAIASRFEGIGPTAFAELRRPIMGTGISLIVNGRGSVLFGDGRLAWSLDEGEAFKSDTVVAVGEVQLGAEYARQLGYGATGFVQCLWEGQLWSNSSGVPCLLGPPMRDDLGLMGVAFNFGIAR